MAIDVWLELLYYGANSKGDPEYGIQNHGVVGHSHEDNILFQRLVIYYWDIGVKAYRTSSQAPLANIEWQFQGNWYSTEDIERIRKLPKFIL